MREGQRVDLGSARGEAGTSAQVLDASGREIAREGQDLAALLTPAELAAAPTHPLEIGRRRLPEGDDTAVRIAAAPVTVAGRRFIVIAGERLDERDTVLDRLRWLLAVGGSIALVVASVAAYALATAALRPVEAMRRRAARISGRTAGERLPLGPAGDELHRLGETLNEMLERIDRAIAHERAFVADASHELRSPLTILKGELDLAMRPGRSEDEMRGAVRSAQEEADRLVQLAEDLLVIARLDEGRLPVRVEPLDAAGLLGDVRSRFAARAASAGREIRVDVASPIEVTADRLRIEQALGNLVENALRHGGGAVTLAAEPADDGAVRLRVRDEGAGFPAGFPHEAFERFTRADPGRARGGAGLGLAIVDAIASAHGGRAGIGKGPGGEVWIELPGPPAAAAGG